MKTWIGAILVKQSALERRLRAFALEQAMNPVLLVSSCPAKTDPELLAADVLTNFAATLVQPPPEVFSGQFPRIQT